MTIDKNVFYIETMSPKAEEYLTLRKKAGLSPRQLIASQVGLKKVSMLFQLESMKHTD